jgi:hypothetical protein
MTTPPRPGPPRDEGPHGTHSTDGPKRVKPSTGAEVAPTDDLASLRRRLTEAESMIFEAVEQIRRVGDIAEVTAKGLDDIDELLASASAPALPTPCPQPLAHHADSRVPGAVPLSTLHAWAAEHIAPRVRDTTISSGTDGNRWCSRWWEHWEAVERFTALYYSHRELSTSDQPQWLSLYLRDHLDHHLWTLTSPRGPFGGCTPDKHTPARALGQAELPTSGAGGELS